MDNSEVNAVIRAGDHYLFEKFGTNTDLSERKSLSKTIHGLFPQLSSKIALKKLSMKLYNTSRKPKEKSAGKKAKVRNNVIEGNEKPSNGFKDSNANDTAAGQEAEYLDSDHAENDAKEDDYIYEIVESDGDNDKDEFKDDHSGMYSVS